MSYKNLELRKQTAREYYSKKPHLAKNNQEKKRQRNRDLIHEHCGCECRICGSTQNLEYDHINPALKKSRLSFLSIGKQDLIIKLIIYKYFVVLVTLKEAKHKEKQHIIYFIICLLMSKKIG